MSLDSNGMTKLLTACEKYELDVEEKRKEVPSMSTASSRFCVKPHVLCSMHSTGVFEKRAAGASLVNLTADQVKKSIEEAVDTVRKEPEARVAEAALIGTRMQMSVENSRRGV